MAFVFLLVAGLTLFWAIRVLAKAPMPLLVRVVVALTIVAIGFTPIVWFFLALQGLSNDAQ